jgi:hypothetical protein
VVYGMRASRRITLHGAVGSGLLAGALGGCELVFPVDALTSGGAPASFCASLSPKPLFCQDFDRAPLAMEGWDEITGVGGSSSLSGSEFVSAPSALQVQSGALSRNATVDVAAYKAFAALAATPAVFTFSLDLRVDLYDSSRSSDAVLCAFVLKDAAGTVWSLQLAATYDGTNLSVDFAEDAVPSGGGPEVYASHPASKTLPLAAWTRVTMEVTLHETNGPAAATRNTARLLFGSVEVANVALHVLAVDGTPEIVVGYEWITPPSPPWSSLYDDVTFDSRAL